MSFSFSGSLFLFLGMFVVFRWCCCCYVFDDDGIAEKKTKIPMVCGMYIRDMIIKWLC